MEYYNLTNDEYERILNSFSCQYKIKVQLLGCYEDVVGEITKDVSIDAQGQININFQQLTRRSCSLTLINIDKKYVPSPDNVVWVDRKFKLWIGATNGENVYWFSQGVFVTQDASADNGTVNIEAIDKGGVLDGTLKTGCLDVQYIIKSGSAISKLIKDTLMINMTDSSRLGGLQITTRLLDSIPPIIDWEFNNMTTQADISLDANSYIGNLFTSLADGYGADVYYNGNGQMVFSKSVTASRIDEYNFIGAQWHFKDLTSQFQNPNYTYKFDGVNCVTVYTNSSTLKNVSYTAYNNSPLSPLRVGAVGVRRLNSQEIDYVAGKVSDMEKRCRDYADYLLLKESLLGMSISFNSPIIPHLDVNKPILITDKLKNLNAERYVVQSITIPLGAGEMNISATNVNWLPNTVDIEKS
jgi:hypothetical protein